MNRTLRVLGLVILGLPLTGGCGRSTVVTGTVTYDGKPVENGSITFLPTDGKGPAAGGVIAAGRYRVEPIAPGVKIVQVVGVKAVPFARSSGEMASRAAAAAKQGDRTGVIDRADVVPANAEGNQAQVEVKPGSQQVDFHLKKPAADS